MGKWIVRDVVHDMTRRLDVYRRSPKLRTALDRFSRNSIAVVGFVDAGPSCSEIDAAFDFGATATGYKIGV